MIVSKTWESELVAQCPEFFPRHGFLGRLDAILVENVLVVPHHIRAVYSDGDKVVIVPYLAHLGDASE